MCGCSIHATFLELSNAQATSGKALDAVSQWAAVTKGAASPRDEFVVNIDPCSGHGVCTGVESAIRSGDWKYMNGVEADTWYPVSSSASEMLSSAAVESTESSTQWLFNVSADPGEVYNLVDKYPEVVAKLQAKLDAAAGEALAPCNVPNGTCAEENKSGWSVIQQKNAWVPWVKDT